MLFVHKTYVVCFHRVSVVVPTELFLAVTQQQLPSWPRRVQSLDQTFWLPVSQHIDYKIILLTYKSLHHHPPP